MKNIYILKGVFLLMFLLPNACFSQTALQKIFTNFAQEYENYNIPNLQLKYVDNLQSIPDVEELNKQSKFFKKYEAELKKIKVSELNPAERLEYEHLAYEIQLNQERIQISKKFMGIEGAKETNDRGLYYQTMGKEWYKYYLKKWLSVEISPKELMEFGRKEVSKVQGFIRDIQATLGYAEDSAGFYQHLLDKEFLLTDMDEILRRYAEMDVQMREMLPTTFEVTSCPKVNVEPIPNVTKDSPPGIYNPLTKAFYFSFFQNEHNTRGMKFLYIHEAIPGHHYQIQLAQELENRPAFAHHFNYGAYIEGWAAYCEELGEELGLYASPYERLGRLEWDLVRSTRVVLDVGLNYYGWTKEEALAYWKANVAGQDAIAMREIDRMIRWPVQIHTYKVGAETIKQVRKKAEEEMKEAFDLKSFHAVLLNSGAVPLAVLEKRIALGL